jgi:hypothetical protein
MDYKGGNRGNKEWGSNNDQWRIGGENAIIIIPSCQELSSIMGLIPFFLSTETMV